MPEIKLTQEHRQFIIQQRAMFVMSNTVIAKRLEDKAYADKFGFKPIKIHDSRISQILNKETDPKEIQVIRQKWLSDFNDTPLAHKKNRVQELVQLYEDAESADFSTAKSTGEYQRKIIQMGLLRQIKDEIGDDIDKLTEALKAPVHVIYENRIENIRAGLAAFGYELPSEN